MFNLKNGFTVEKIIKTLKERNNGDRCMIGTLDGPTCAYSDGIGNHCAVGLSSSESCGM